MMGTFFGFFIVVAFSCASTVETLPTAQWGACPFDDSRTKAIRKSLEKSTNENTKTAKLECGRFAVPLSWEEPGRFEELTIWVTRLVATGGGGATPKRHLWVINGGPGCANEVMATLFTRIDGILEVLGGDIEVYFPDHRGTGMSSPWMNCSSLDPEKAAQCGKELVGRWGEGLSKFSTSSAAKDIDFLMRTLSLNAGAKEIHLYGASYGLSLLLSIFFSPLPLSLSLGLDSPNAQERSWFRGSC